MKYNKERLQKLAGITISEGKNIGDLYHFTSLRDLESILKTNVLKTKYDNKHNQMTNQDHIRNDKRPYISLTRSKNKNPWEGIVLTKSTCIVIDGSLLSNNYKISPISFSGDPKFKSGKEKVYEGYYDNSEVEKQEREKEKNKSSYDKKIHDVMGEFDVSYDIANMYISNFSNGKPTITIDQAEEIVADLDSEEDDEEAGGSHLYTTEYEERVYKDITNFSKYIKKIIFDGSKRSGDAYSGKGYDVKSIWELLKFVKSKGIEIEFRFQDRDDIDFTEEYVPFKKSSVRHFLSFFPDKEYIPPYEK